MSDYTLTVPEELYQRALRIAEQTNQAVNEILLEHLRTLSDELPGLSEDEEAELEALKFLSDDALWAIARERISDTANEQLQQLMDRNTQGTITATEFEMLKDLVERGEKRTLRKSEAAAILTKRGYKLTPPKNPELARALCVDR